MMIQCLCGHAIEEHEMRFSGLLKVKCGGKDCTCVKFTRTAPPAEKKRAPFEIYLGEHFKTQGDV